MKLHDKVAAKTYLIKKMLMVVTFIKKENVSTMSKKINVNYTYSATFTKWIK